MQPKVSLYFARLSVSESRSALKDQFSKILDVMLHLKDDTWVSAMQAGVLQMVHKNVAGLCTVDKLLVRLRRLNDLPLVGWLSF
jgi:hypothetical protein